MHKYLDENTCQIRKILNVHIKGENTNTAPLSKAICVDAAHLSNFQFLIFLGSSDQGTN